MFIIQSADLIHIFDCDLEQNQTGVIVEEKGPHYPQFSKSKLKNTFPNDI